MIGDCVLDIKRHVQCPVTLTAISIWLANGAKVGTLVVVTIVRTFLVWFELGSATTFQNLICDTGAGKRGRCGRCGGIVRM